MVCKEIYAAKCTAYTDDDSETSCVIGAFDIRDKAIDELFRHIETCLLAEIPEDMKDCAIDRLQMCDTATVWAGRHAILLQLTTLDYYPESDKE